MKDKGKYFQSGHTKALLNINIASFPSLACQPPPPLRKLYTLQLTHTYPQRYCTKKKTLPEIVLRLTLSGAPRTFGMKGSLKWKNHSYYLNSHILGWQPDIFSKAIVSNLCNSKKETPALECVCFVLFFFQWGSRSRVSGGVGYRKVNGKRGQMGKAS